MRTLLVLFLGSLLSVVASSAGANPYEKSVVLIHVTKQLTDFSAPWAKKDVEIQTHMGTLVAKGTILTTAYGVSDAKQIEMQRFGQTAKIPLEVKFLDYEVNLALLTTKDEADLDGLQILSLGDELPLFSDVRIESSRRSVELGEQIGNIKQVNMEGSLTSSYLIPFYGIEVPKVSGFGWSEPVIANGRLAAITSDQEKNVVFAIPVSIIKHFLSDSLKGEATYKGFPFLGVTSQPLSSPSYRKLLKADKSNAGLRISRVLDTSPFAGLLQVDDVLVKVGGVQIDDRGHFNHGKWGRIYFSYLVNKLYAGDFLNLEIWREGKPLQVKAKLTRFDRNKAPIPFFRADHDEPHLIFGGLVFQELSRPYLMSWGKNWEKIIPYEFSYLLNFKNFPSRDTGERVVILNRVLADEFNRGYENFGQAIVQTVNGKKVCSIRELELVLRANPVQKAAQSYAKIKFAQAGGEVILTYAELDAVHKRIAENYGINTPSSFFKLR